MFGRKLKDEFVKKRYYITNVETGVVTGIIYYSEYKIIDTMIFPVIILTLIGILFGYAYMGFVAGIIASLITLYLSTEKIGD